VLIGAAANRLDVIAVGIEDEGGVAGRVIMPAEAGQAVVDPDSGKAGSVGTKSRG
jgi:hypothetical protein